MCFEIPLAFSSFKDKKSIMTYYVQEFKYQNGSTILYGEQTEHNHNKSNQFTTDALDWLVTNARWPRAAIEIGKFKSGQGKPGQGKEFKWTAAVNKWVKQ